MDVGESSRKRKAETAYGFDHLRHHRLGIAVNHVAVVSMEKRIDDAGCAVNSD